MELDSKLENKRKISRKMWPMTLVLNFPILCSLKKEGGFKIEIFASKLP